MLNRALLRNDHTCEVWMKEEMMTTFAVKLLTFKKHLKKQKQTIFRLERDSNT